jgi:YD repeat-containing protein
MSLDVPGYPQPFVFCYTQVNANTNFWGYGEENHTTGCVNVTVECPEIQYYERRGFLGYAMQSVKLPSGDAWRFYYDSAPNGDTTTVSYGTLSRITSPTGGSISYCYQLGIPPHTELPSDVIVNGTNTEPLVPLLSRRIVDPAGGSIDCSSTGSIPLTASEWDYAMTTPSSDAFPSDITTTSNVAPIATKVTNPDSTYTVYNYLIQSNYFLPATKDGVVTDTYDPRITGNPRVKREIQNNLVENIPQVEPEIGGEYQVESVTTPSNGSVLLDGQTVSDFYRSYDISSSYNAQNMFNAGAISCVYDYYGTDVDGSCHMQPPASMSLGIATWSSDGPRQATTQYEAMSNPSYAEANLLDLPASVTTTENGATATTNYTYDESGYVPSGANIGHLTSVTQVNNSGPNVTTHTAWDSYGMIDHTVDGKGTTTSTNSQWDSIHLFPTVVTSPLGQEEFAHDPNTGALLSHTDLNGQTTTYTYDTAGRPLTVHTPDLAGAGTYSSTQCYPDANTAIEYQAQQTPLSSPSADGKTCAAAAADTIVTTVKADGLERVTDTIVQSAPGGAIDVTKQYDGFDRVVKVSNPYLVGSSPVWTTSHYDAAGRVYEEDEPDGISKKTWTFSGPVTTATDESGKSTQSTVDLLGRVVQVMEPTSTNPTPSIPTQYTYDLNGLRSVYQQGDGSVPARSRSFTYDSLSRLILSTNPETGTICYGTTGGAVPNGYNCTAGYDANGNLQAKTDARGITTNYTYDSSNRLIMKTYSYDPSGVPSSCYRYDTATNGIGKLGAEWTQPGYCPATAPSTGYKTKRTFFAYDAVGRVLSEQQCVLTNCTTTTPPSCPNASASQTYCYDLAGNLTWYASGTASISYIGGLAFTNTYDAANRLSTVSSSWSDSLHPSSLFIANPSTGYTPAGALQNFNLGPQIVVKKTYDNFRLWPTSEVATHP